MVVVQDEGSDKNINLKKQLEDPSMYKIILQGLSSKSDKVIKIIADSIIFLKVKR